jgi:hypothetical protein
MIICLVSVIDEEMSRNQWWNDTERGNGSNRRNPWSTANSNTTHPTCACLGPSPGLRGDRPVTDMTRAVQCLLPCSLESTAASLNSYVGNGSNNCSNVAKEFTN